MKTREPFTDHRGLNPIVEDRVEGLLLIDLTLKLRGRSDVSIADQREILRATMQASLGDTADGIDIGDDTITTAEVIERFGLSQLVEDTKACRAEMMKELR